ncbi:MAG: hypothetical protein NXI04_26650 [Planctomycetaceae bacterium]|nr:hypothetical protein [Planctomycetaceae bacterium]
MKKLGPVIQWMVNITLLLLVAAGGAYIYVWHNSDRLVQDQIRARFEEAAPGLRLSVAETQLHGTQGVTLQDVEIRERTTDRPLFRCRELNVSIDSQRLIDHQQVAVSAVKVRGAEVVAARDEFGQWNWQKYEFRKPTQSVPGLPQITVEDLTIQLTLQHGAGIPTARLILQCPQWQAVPASQHAYDFNGGVALPGVGELKLAGGADLNSRQWDVSGALKNVRANQDLMQVAQATAPQLQSELSKIDTALERLLPPAQTAAAPSGSTALMIGTDARTAPQFLGLLDVDFRASSSTKSVIPEFMLRVAVKDGRLAAPALPVVLSDVNAVFFRDNNNLIVRLNHAQGGRTRLSGEFESRSGPQAAPGKGKLEVEHFPLTPEAAEMMPEKMARLVRAFSPHCLISGSVNVVQQPDGRWRPEGLKAEISKGRVNFHRFQYPNTNIRGTVVQRDFVSRPATGSEPALTDRDVMLDVELQGEAGGRSVTTRGWMKNPGVESENFFTLTATDFPLDSEFRNALEPKAQSVMDSLNLSGTADLNLAFYRPPGQDKPTHPFYRVHVRDSRMRFARFPYTITGISGDLTYDGGTKEWKFLKLQGQHDEAKITAQGSFRGDTRPGVLDLTVRARNAALDSDLYNALTQQQQTLWKMIRPEGFCDLTAKIDWVAAPGQAASVRFPASEPVRIFNTTIQPVPFPYEMQVQEAVLSFDPNDPRFAGVQHAEIHSFRAMHDESPLSASGWAEVKHDGEWQVHLNRVNAQDLQPDDHLKAALPASWRSALSRLYHRGKLKITDSEMDFRGTIAGDRQTTAKWHLNMHLYDCALNAGLDMEHVHGEISALGEWDGYRLTNRGQINLETTETLEMPITNIRGPYSMNNVELILGSRRVFEGGEHALISRDSRLRAQAYGGDLFLDAIVDMREDGRYWFFTELENARLESYAQLHIAEQQNLRGLVNAWMSLRGAGEDSENCKGQGQMLISPASLYELPVVVKLLGALSQLHLNVQDRTAFNHVMMDFGVRNKAFQMNYIDMVGEAISFRGKGSVGFSGAVNLDFYSRPPRASVGSLPLFNNLFTNWAKVEVRGTTSDPQTIVKSAAKLDNGLKQFLQPFNPNPNGPAPLLTLPPAFQRPAGGYTSSGYPAGVHAGDRIGRANRR